MECIEELSNTNRDKIYGLERDPALVAKQARQMREDMKVARDLVVQGPETETLSRQESDIVRAVWDPERPLDEVVCDFSGDKLTREAVTCLLDDRWLSSHVIDMWVKLRQLDNDKKKDKVQAWLADTSFMTVNPGRDGQVAETIAERLADESNEDECKEHWARNVTDPGRSILIIPLNSMTLGQGLHWRFICVRLGKSNLVLGYCTQRNRGWEERLVEVSNWMENADPITGFNVKRDFSRCCVKQVDDSSCGVLMLMEVDKLLRGPETAPVNNACVGFYRRKILAYLCSAWFTVRTTGMPTGFRLY